MRSAGQTTLKNTDRLRSQDFCRKGILEAASIKTSNLVIWDGLDVCEMNEVNNKAKQSKSDMLDKVNRKFK